VVADETIAENVVSLPLHPQNKVLGAMNNAIELGRG
jgi:NADH-quinone oxidoreductase subunit G